MVWVIQFSFSGSGLALDRITPAGSACRPPESTWTSKPSCCSRKAAVALRRPVSQ